MSKPDMKRGSGEGQHKCTVNVEVLDDPTSGTGPVTGWGRERERSYFIVIGHHRLNQRNMSTTLRLNECTTYDHASSSNALTCTY